MIMKLTMNSVIGKANKVFMNFIGLRFNSSINNPSAGNFSNNFYDVIIVGGGIVGLATAREILCRNPGLKCAVLEKENALGRHQSSHNSGVIHAGIYYKPGSERAKMCTRGMELMYKYLDEKEIPYKKVGKLIVAICKEQTKTLDDLFERGKLNNVKDLRLVDSKEIRFIEPHCAGIKAIHSPHTGIVDFGVVTEHYGRDFRKLGGKICLNFEVISLQHSEESNDKNHDINRFPIRISSKKGKAVYASFVLTCAGLYSDKIAVMSGGSKVPAIIPFRGEYLLLKAEKQYLVKGNIYPVPDIRFPFLGVHFTPKQDGTIWLGPNAILSFKREGYRYSDLSLPELWEIITYRGFHKVASKYYTYGIKEYMKSAFLRFHVAELKKFVPQLTVTDVIRGPSGVRAQAINAEGVLIEDFVFEIGENERILHCRNTPSPAATSSLAIGQELADKVLDKLRKL